MGSTAAAQTAPDAARKAMFGETAVLSEDTIHLGKRALLKRKLKVDIAERFHRPFRAADATK